MAKLKSIQEWNEERGNKGWAFVLTGIACDRCGHELCMRSPGIMYTTNPPLKSVYCDNCGWSGTVLA